MNIYSPLHPAAFFMIQRRQREFRKIFACRFPSGMESARLLEVGCGNGQWLAEFQTFGILPENMAGIELDKDRANSAKKRITGGDIRHGDAAELPWTDNSFDIVFQSTVFTSIPDGEVRKKAAGEMKRVCKKETGLILWYDFIYNSPGNSNVRGISRKEIKSLFHPWNCEFRKVTLAPPIARTIVPFSWSLAEDLETFCPFLRTHVIAVLTF